MCHNKVPRYVLAWAIEENSVTGGKYIGFSSLHHRHTLLRPGHDLNRIPTCRQAMDKSILWITFST